MLFERYLSARTIRHVGFDGFDRLVCEELILSRVDFGATFFGCQCHLTIRVDDACL